jgi:F0F1-type ATP synthase alpha subunit
MPDINKMYPSKYLKSSDLQGGQFTMVIDRIVHEKVVENEPEKWCIYFSGKERGMVLNKTNALVLANGLGDDTDLWIGKSVLLFTEKTNFNGRTVDGLRLAPTSGEPAVHQPQPVVVAQNPPLSSGPPPNNDDDLPF